MKNLSIKSKGFTLVELLIATFILIMVFTMVNSGFLKKQRGMEFEIVSDEIYNGLFEARENSRNFKDGYVYGVRLNTDDYQVFRWSAYVSTGVIVSNTLPWFLEINSLSLNGGGNEIVFSKNTGATDDYGNFKLVSDDGENMTFEISQHGLINLTYNAH